MIYLESQFPPGITGSDHFLSTSTIDGSSSDNSTVLRIFDSNQWIASATVWSKYTARFGRLVKVAGVSGSEKGDPIIYPERHARRNSEAPRQESIAVTLDQLDCFTRSAAFQSRLDAFGVGTGLGRCGQISHRSFFELCLQCGAYRCGIMGFPHLDSPGN